MILVLSWGLANYSDAVDTYQRVLPFHGFYGDVHCALKGGKCVLQAKRQTSVPVQSNMCDEPGLVYVVFSSSICQLPPFTSKIEKTFDVPKLPIHLFIRRKKWLSLTVMALN